MCNYRCKLTKDHDNPDSDLGFFFAGFHKFPHNCHGFGCNSRILYYNENEIAKQPAWEYDCPLCIVDTKGDTQRKLAVRAKATVITATSLAENKRNVIKLLWSLEIK